MSSKFTSEVVLWQIIEGPGFHIIGTTFSDLTEEPHWVFY